MASKPILRHRDKRHVSARALARAREEARLDHTTHPLLEIKQVPTSLIQLREELQHHTDICEYAAKGTTFEECLGKIALQLDIALDGIYDMDPLCEVLLIALKNRRLHGRSPHLRAPGLVDVEMIETEGGLELTERDRSISTLAGSDGAVVIEIDTTGPKLPVYYGDDPAAVKEAAADDDWSDYLSKPLPEPEVRIAEEDNSNEL